MQLISLLTECTRCTQYNSFNLVSKYFQHDECRKITFDQVISLFKYKQIVENIFDVGSNERMNITNCITEFQLFLLQIGWDSISLGGKDILDYEQLFCFRNCYGQNTTLWF